MEGAVYSEDVLVSVVIPCYNASEYLEEALFSICNQTYQNIEILIIDDGSTDNTYEILQRLKAKDVRLRIYRNDRNCGIIKSLNKAIELCKGQYIVRMDADDVALQSRIQLQVEYLESNKDCTAVASTGILIDHKGHYLGYVANHGCYHNGSGLFMSFFECPYLHSAICIRTEVLKQYKYRDEKDIYYIEDYDLWLRLFSDNFKLEVIESPLLLNRVHLKSISRSYMKTQKGNFMNSSRIFMHQILNKSFPNDMLSILQLDISSFASYRNIVVSFELFDMFATDFINGAKLNTIEKTEIGGWIVQRKLKVIWIGIIRGRLTLGEKTKLIKDGLILCCRNLNRETLFNIRNHSGVMFKARIYKIVYNLFS